MKNTGSIYFSSWLSFGTTTASRTFFIIYGGPQRREILFLWGTKIALNKNWPRSKLQKKRIRLHSISSEMLRSQFACKHLPRSHLQKKSSGLHSRSSFLIREHNISPEMPRSQVRKKRNRLHSNYPFSHLRVFN